MTKSGKFFAAILIVALLIPTGIAPASAQIPRQESCVNDIGGKIGVVNERDYCASTPEVEATGCIAGEVYVKESDLVLAGLHGWGPGGHFCMAATEWNALTQSVVEESMMLLDEEVVQPVGEVIATEEVLPGGTTVGGNDWYVKNKYRYIASKWLDSSICDNRSGNVAMTCTLGLSGSVSHNISFNLGFGVSVVNASVGYGIMWTGTTSHQVSVTVPKGRCTRVKLFQDYRVTRFEFWEDDVWNDDYLGTFRVRNRYAKRAVQVRC